MLFYKVLREDMTDNNFVYKLGLNIDTLPFNPVGCCEQGGLYYTDEQHITDFADYGELIADVVIPEGAKI